MKTVSATAARSDLYRLIDSTISDHEPVQITGKRGNAVLMPESDWRAIQETLHLLKIPGMHDGVVINDGGGEEDEVEFGVGVGVELVDVRGAELGLGVTGGASESWGQCANLDTITLQPAGSHASLRNPPAFLKGESDCALTPKYELARRSSRRPQTGWRGKIGGRRRHGNGLTPGTTRHHVVKSAGKFNTEAVGRGTFR